MQLIEYVSEILEQIYCLALIERIVKIIRFMLMHYFSFFSVPSIICAYRQMTRGEL